MIRKGSLVRNSGSKRAPLGKLLMAHEASGEWITVWVKKPDGKWSKIKVRVDEVEEVVE